MNSQITVVNLRDADGRREGDLLECRIKTNYLGIAISFEGHGDHVSLDEQSSSPVFIEFYEGQIQVRVYSDINSEEPTHNICLSNAREGARAEEEPPQIQAPLSAVLEAYANGHIHYVREWLRQSALPPSAFTRYYVDQNPSATPEDLILLLSRLEVS